MSKSNLNTARQSKKATTDCAVSFKMKHTLILFKIKNFATKSNLCYSDLHVRLSDEDVIKFNIKFLKSTFGTKSSALMVVHFDSIGKHSSVHFEISLMDSEDKQDFTQDVIATHESNTRVLSYSLDSIGITATDSGFLNNDTLEFAFVVKAAAVGKLTKNHYQQQGATSKVLQDYDTLLESAKFADVVLVVGKGRVKKEFHAHKNILTVRSPVFGAMFEHKNTKEAQESRVVITDVAVDVFELFIRFVYTGKVIQMDKFAQDLLTVADKYQMDCLKTLCSHYLSTQLTTESVSSILVLADLHNAAELKSNCVDYIADHAEQVMATEDFTKHIVNKPALMLELFQRQSTKRFKNV